MTGLPTFKLEDYLAKYEFSAPYLLCCSDAESWSLNEIVAQADPESRELWQNLRLGYTEVQGMPLLRQEIAKLYPGLQADHILCFAGAEEGVFCTLMALLEPQDHVIVVTPCYQSLFEIPKYKGCTVTRLELQENESWQLNLDTVKAAIRPNTKWFVMNFPHNPTGQILDPQSLQALVQLLDQHGIYLFSDEVYRLLGEVSPPAASVYPKAISLGVMTKSYGLAGLRIGWIACKDSMLLEKVARTKHYTSICNSALSEIVALMALRQQDRLLARNNAIIKANLPLVENFLEKHADHFSWVKPRGGCIGFVKYHDKEPVDQLCDRLAKEAGVLLLPASVYDLPTNHFRIGFGRKNMPEALEKLEAFVNARKRSKLH